MTVEFELVRGGRVILQIYGDPLDMGELAETAERLQREILDHATRPVHTLTDATRVTKVPTNLLRGGASTLKNVHPMGGQIVIVTGNGFVNTMSTIFSRIVPQYRVTVFKTMDEGWAEIERIMAMEQSGTDSNTG